MRLGDLICLLFLAWTFWRGYQNGLVGVLFQWFGLFLSLIAVWYIQKTNWWVEWGVGAASNSSSFLWKWGLLAGILVGIQLLFIALSTFLNSVFKAMGLNFVNRWVGAFLAGTKWVTILALTFFFSAKIPFVQVWLKSTFPISSDWWISLGGVIWAIFN